MSESEKYTAINIEHARLHRITNLDFGINNTLFALNKLMQERQRITKEMLKPEYTEDQFKEFYKLLNYVEKQICNLLDINYENL